MVDAGKTRGVHNARGVKWLLMGWAAIVMLVFVWQTIGYLGWTARAGEWEFGRFGGYFPALTTAMFVILFAAPVLYLFSMRYNQDLRPTHDARVPAKRFLYVLGALTALFGVAAIIVAALPLLEARRVQPVAAIRIGSPAATNAPSGPTALQGRMLLGRAAIERSKIFGYTRSTRYIPVVAENARATALQFFVATSSTTVAPIVPVKGFLKADALPGHVARLYSDAGVKVAPDTYVLYTDQLDRRLPYISRALQLALVALVFGLAALIQRYRLRKLLHKRREGSSHAVA